MLILDCKTVAQKIKDDVKAVVQLNTVQEKTYKRVPVLCIIQVGDNPASNAYIRGKMKDAEEVGIKVDYVKLPEKSTDSDINHEISKRTYRSGYTLDGIHYHCDGVIVQLPLPKHIDVSKISIPEYYDVDGFQKKSSFLPCTPSGVMELIDSIGYNLDGKIAMIIGQSPIVGAPLCDMLMKRHCNVISINSSMEKYIREEMLLRADVLITAAGRMNLITENDLDCKWSAGINGYENTGSCPDLIIDVGINYKDGKQYGDCSEELRSEKYYHCFDITPRIGGVGLLTRAKLMENVAISCYGAKEYWFK